MTATPFPYANFYDLAPFSGNDYTISFDEGISSTATDISTSDTGVFHVGDTINDGIGDFGTLEGYAGNGIVVNISGSYFLLTNDTYTLNQTITITRSDFAFCFLAGTMIATPEGERAVEDLAIGDLVLTAKGDTRPVRWMGVQSAMRIFSDPIRSRPVTIRKGALYDNVPHRDLHVSPDHAMYIDGILAHAGALVNGTSIVRMADVPERFTYYHIELEGHELVLAEGAPAETFVDAVTRRRFDNHAEYTALYGEEQPDMIVEHDAPRALSARQLSPEIRERLALRAEALGFVETIAA